LKIGLDEVAYIGDDINDLDALRIVGFSACPADAVPEVKAAARYVCSIRGGGDACARLWS
jgi:3-deoxy-D-manno-octulosonate 8-phosphate phosphatase (KDO 8-P phosphatase)